ncbi:MAG: hypothetical protein F4Z04_11490 [Acidobacteria bacterium]|nr:hypothetical protein [Acidobacteriota bacterium]
MRREFWVALFVLVIFVTGLAAGIIVTRSSPFGWFGPRPRPPAFAGREMSGPPMRQRLMQRISERLDLTDQQEERLEQVFEARRERFRAEREAMRQRIETEEETFRSEIADILTPEQLETFNAVIVRLDDERRRRGGSGWPGGPGGRRPMRARAP